MDKLQTQLLMFYCKQLKITTFKQLQELKQKYKINNNSELINLLTRLFNSDCYYYGVN